jgi:hypothetical protein
LPEVRAAGDGGAPHALFGPHPRARLVCVGFDRDGAAAGGGEPTLPEVLGRSRAELERLGLEVLGLGPAGVRPASELWPWPWLAPLRDEMSVLAFLSRAAFEHGAGLPADAAYLIDSSGRLRAVYRGALDVGALIEHAALLDATPERLRDAALPFQGRWHAPPPGADLSGLAGRAQARGEPALARALSSLALTGREDTEAARWTELALVRLRQGEALEAARLLGEAAARAPGWELPPLHLGRALLALERPAEAALAFERALSARPLERGALSGLSRALSELGLSEPVRELERFGGLLDSGSRADERR